MNNYRVIVDGKYTYYFETESDMRRAVDALKRGGATVKTSKYDTGGWKRYDKSI